MSTRKTAQSAPAQLPACDSEPSSITFNETEIAFLCELFRLRADAYMRKAREAKPEGDVVMFTAFAAALDWAAREVRWTLRFPGLTKIRVDQTSRERLSADVTLDKEDLHT